MKNRLSLLLAAAVLISAAPGCVYDQGKRMELDEFLGKIKEEEDFDTPSTAILPDEAARKQRMDVYQVGAGDVVEISIMGLVAPRAYSSILRRVRQDGTIMLPLLDGNDTTINVDGLKPEEIEQKVTEKYAPNYIKDPQVTVMVANYKTVPVIVMGQVNQPGVINLKRDEMNVLTAVMRAGWMRDTSNGRVTVKKAKGGLESYHLNLAADVSRALNELLEDGDIVEVERRAADAAYVMGLIRSPGPISMAAGGRLTFLQLLASAGGPDYNLDPRECTLIRVADNGNIYRVRVDFEDIMSARKPDFEIKPGDIVDVHHTYKTRAFETINKFIKVGAGVDLTYNPFMWGFGFPGLGN